MGEKQNGFAWQITSLVLITVIGHGFVWEYKRLNIENEKLSIERMKNDIEKEKLLIERSIFENEKDKKAIEESKQKVNESLLEIEINRNKAEMEKHKIERIKDSISLREKKSDILYKIVGLTSEYLSIQKERDTNWSADGKMVDEAKGALLYNKMNRLVQLLDTYKDDYNNIEINLANIEGRKPANVYISFPVPQPPIKLTIE